MNSTAEKDAVDRVLELLDEIEHALAQVRELAAEMKGPRDE